MKKLILAAVLLCAGFVLFGCTEQQQLLGGDRDAHGCIPSAGYQWCDATQKCYRSFEENCTSIMPGGDRDAHGCIPSAGYSWCEASQKCIRSWEENCTSAVEVQAQQFCGNATIAKVYTCGEYVRTVSKLLGGGSTFYKDGQLVAHCPIVAPDYMSDQCKQLLLGNNCVEKEIC